MPVLVGERGFILERPVDRKIRIVPADASFVLRGPVVCRLVEKLDHFREHQEAMGKARGIQARR